MIYFINQVLKSKTYVYIAIKKEINNYFYEDDILLKMLCGAK